MRPVHSCRGISLLELVIFIMITGFALVGIASAINYNVQHTADPVVKKQALEIAESLLEEIELMPFTICDPNDANLSSATLVSECATLPEVAGPETLGGGDVSRGASLVSAYDNVNDYVSAYDSDALMSVANINGTTPANLSDYRASVQISPVTLSSITASDALRIRVTVTGPQNNSVVLEGYRTRYDPNLKM